MTTVGVKRVKIKAFTLGRQLSQTHTAHNNDKRSVILAENDNLPVRMIGQNLYWLDDVSYVPEFRQAVISTAGQVILSVWVEVEITDQLAMCTVDTVRLSEIHQIHSK